MATMPSDIKNCWKIKGIFIAGIADNDDGCGDQEGLWWAEAEPPNYRSWCMVTFIRTEGTAISCSPCTPKIFCLIWYQKLIWKCHVGFRLVSPIDGWGNMQITVLHSVTCIIDISRTVGVWFKAVKNMIDTHLCSSDISRCKCAWTSFTQENRCAWVVNIVSGPYVHIFIRAFCLTRTIGVQIFDTLRTLFFFCLFFYPEQYFEFLLLTKDALIW